jgi:hypothetical protein
MGAGNKGVTGVGYKRTETLTIAQLAPEVQSRKSDEPDRLVSIIGIRNPSENAVTASRESNYCAILTRFEWQCKEAVEPNVGRAAAWPSLPLSVRGVA